MRKVRSGKLPIARGCRANLTSISYFVNGSGAPIRRRGSLSISLGGRTRRSAVAATKSTRSTARRKLTSGISVRLHRNEYVLADPSATGTIRQISGLKSGAILVIMYLSFRKVSEV